MCFHTILNQISILKDEIYISLKVKMNLNIIQFLCLFRTQLFRGVHRSRTGPDRPGPKTERGACSGPRTGSDRSRTGLVSTLIVRVPEIWHGVAVPQGTAVPRTNFLARCTRAIRHARAVSSSSVPRSGPLLA